MSKFPGTAASAGMIAATATLAGLALWKIRALGTATSGDADTCLPSQFHLVTGNNISLPDFQKFVAALDREKLTQDCSDTDIFIGRAPGRLDVMGGIADYSGSLVLQLPIAEACFVAICKNDSGVYRVSSAAGITSTYAFELPVSELAVDSYVQARALFEGKEGGDWAAYVLGCFVVLSKECAATFSQGCNIQVHSDVPISMGVSSSASVEVSTMQAIVKAFDVPVEEFFKDSHYCRGTKIAMLCQKVENLVVGAPCGIMDQMASNLGEQNKLLALLCRPAELQGLVEVPQEIEFWGLDSGHKHAVGGHAEEGADYGSVRVGAFMGKKIWNSIPKHQLSYTTELLPSDYEWAQAKSGTMSDDEYIATQLPEQMSGKEFCEQFGSHDDNVTSIEPERQYDIRTPTEHPIYEHQRVQMFAELLGTVPSERTLCLLGDMMRSSHISYSKCGLSSTSTDLLVELVQQAGVQAGLYGAKITGGGSGGTVVVLSKAGGEAAVKAVAAKYAAQTGHTPHIFRSSSIGGEAFGCAHLQWKNI